MALPDVSGLLARYGSHATTSRTLCVTDFLDMGPSSGIGFATRVIQDILDDEQPTDENFYPIFSLDDFARNRLLADADSLLWEIAPTNLPPREVADKVNH